MYKYQIDLTDGGSVTLKCDLVNCEVKDFIAFTDSNNLLLCLINRSLIKHVTLIERPTTYSHLK